MKESRRVEDLILSFVTASSKTLRKDLDLGDMWKQELSVQTRQFIDIVSESLRLCGPGSGDLLARLQSYRSNLTVPVSATEPGQTVQSAFDDKTRTEDTLTWVMTELFAMTESAMRWQRSHLDLVCSEQVRLLGLCYFA